MAIFHYFLCIFLLIFVSCSIAPRITYIDTPTQMELDSMGDWSQLEKKKALMQVENTPTPLKEDEDNPRRKRILNVLKGEYYNE